MEFMIGFAGAVLAVGLFVVGAVFGWKFRERVYKREARVTAEQLTEVQKQRLREEAEAWKALHSYSVEDAYAIRPSKEE